MTGKKNSRLVTVELDLEAYKVKNKSLSEHLIKVQQEKAHAYQELNTLRQQYWKIHKKYCSIKNLVEHNMRDNIGLLTKHQERFKKFFMEENDTTTESSMKSNGSRNRSASLHDNRSRRSAEQQNSNDGSCDSLSEGYTTRVVTTRKKYNSDKETSSKGPALANGNVSPTHNGADSTSRMAEVQVNIRKRRGVAENDRKGGGGTDQDLWDVDVRLRAGDSNTNGNSDSSDDDNEEEEEDDDDDDDDGEKLDTIQEEDGEYNYWSESAKRLRLMVTERKSVPSAVVDADSSMACQLDESVIDRTNAFDARESVSPVERRRRMADKYNQPSNVSTSMIFEETAAASTARRSASANVSEDFPDLSNSSRLFMMKSLNLRDMSNPDPLSNDISFQTSTPFGDISPRLRVRSKAESATPTPPSTVLNRGSTTTNSSERSSATMHPKRIFNENENRTAKTSGRDRSDAESSSSGRCLKRGSSSKKLANAVVPVEQKITNKTKSKSKNREDESNYRIEVTVSERDSKTNKKAYNGESPDEAETSPDECEEKENCSENTSGKHFRKCPKRRQVKQSSGSDMINISKSNPKSNPKSEIETTTDASDDESTLTENKCTEDTNKKVSMKNRKRMLSQSKVDKPITIKRKTKHAGSENEAATESSCDNSCTSESEDIEESIENNDQQSNTKHTSKRGALGAFSDNDSTAADPTWKDEGAETTTSSGNETLTGADNEPKHAVRQGGGVTAKKRLGRLSSDDSKKEIKVVLDRAEIQCYTTTAGHLVQQIKKRAQVPAKTKKEQLKLKGTPDISSAGMGESEQASFSALKKVKRLNEVQRYVEMKKNSPRPMRAARPSKPLCESSLKKKMRRSK